MMQIGMIFSGIALAFTQGVSLEEAYRGSMEGLEGEQTCYILSGAILLVYLGVIL
jgi:hypothetical protein